MIVSISMSKVLGLFFHVCIEHFTLLKFLHGCNLLRPPCMLPSICSIYRAYFASMFSITERQGRMHLKILIGLLGTVQSIKTLNTAIMATLGSGQWELWSWQLTYLEKKNQVSHHDLKGVSCYDHGSQRANDTMTSLRKQYSAQWPPPPPAPPIIAAIQFTPSGREHVIGINL